MSNASGISRIAPISMLDVMNEEDIKTGTSMTHYQAQKALLFLQTGEQPIFSHDDDNDTATIERRLSLKNVMPIDYFHKLGFFSSAKSSRSSFQQKQQHSPVSTTSAFSYRNPFGMAANHSGIDTPSSSQVSSPPTSPSKSARIKKFHRRQSFPSSKYATVSSSFEERMAGLGLHVVEVEGDGNCLYRAVAHQFFLDESRHEEIRAKVTKHLKDHRDRFKPFIDGDYDDYISNQMESGTWGDDVEIKVIEEIYDRRVVIYDSEADGALEPMNTNFDEEGGADTAQPIIISYHGQMHYNSVFNEKFSLPIKERRLDKKKSRIMLKRAKSMTNDNCMREQAGPVKKEGSNVTV